jgi:hypothetical protein
VNSLVAGCDYADGDRAGILRFILENTIVALFANSYAQSLLGAEYASKDERLTPCASRLKVSGTLVRFQFPRSSKVLPDKVQPKDKAIRKSEKRYPGFRERFKREAR